MTEVVIGHIWFLEGEVGGREEGIGGNNWEEFVDEFLCIVTTFHEWVTI